MRAEDVEAMPQQALSDADRARRDAALRESQEDPALSVSLDGTVTAWNVAAESFYGYSAAEALGRSLRLIVPDDPSAQLDSVLERVRRGERVELRETVRQHRDGRLLLVSASVSPVFDAGGEVCGASEVTRLLGIRREAERYRLAVEACPSGMVVVDPAGTIVLMNAQTEKLFGYRRHELVGQPLGKLIPERHREAHERYRQTYCGRPDARRMGVGRRLVGLRKDGREVPLDITLSPLGGARVGWVLATVMDATRRAREQERERLEAFAMELRRRNDELQQFAYVVSHDLKAPLRGVASVASWLAEDLGAAAQSDVLEKVQLILDCAERMRRLINGVLVHARIEMQDTAPTRVKSREVVAEVVESLERPEGASIVLRGSLPEVVCDEAQLYQIFLNLVGNAIEHAGSPEVRIEISAQHSGSAWLFRVADDGVGVPEEHGAQIFEPFRTLSGDPARYGTGVGLSIVKRAVEQNGGSVGVGRSELGGAEFWFTIPDRDAGEAGANGSPDSPGCER